MAREKEKRNVLSFFECFLFFYFFLTKNFLVLKTQEKTQLVYRKGGLAWLSLSLSLSLSPDLSLLLCTVVFDLYQAAAPAAAAALASASAAAACCSLRALRTCDGGLARPPSFFMLAPPSEVEETEGGDGAWATAEAGRGGARAALAGGLRLPNTSIGASEAEEAGTAAAAARAAGIGGAKGFCVGGGRGGEEAIIVAVGGVCGAVVVARGCWFWLSFCCFPRLSLLRGAAAAAAAAACFSPSPSSPSSGAARGVAAAAAASVPAASAAAEALVRRRRLLRSADGRGGCGSSHRRNAGGGVRCGSVHGARGRGRAEVSCRRCRRRSPALALLLLLLLPVLVVSARLLLLLLLLLLGRRCRRHHLPARGHDEVLGFDGRRSGRRRRRRRERERDRRGLHGRCCCRFRIGRGAPPLLHRDRLPGVVVVFRGFSFFFASRSSSGDRGG
jgi:hypothetical protein